MKEGNVSLPEIGSVDKSNNQGGNLDRMNKNNIKQVISKLHDNLSGQGVDRRQLHTHASAGSFSNIPLSSSKRPQNSIGFQEGKQQAKLSEKAKKLQKQQTQQTSQKLKLSNQPQQRSGR